MLGTTEVKNNSSGFAIGTYDYRDTLLASERVKWNIDDIIGGDKRLDFSKRFMPETLARVEDSM